MKFFFFYKFLSQNVFPNVGMSQYVYYFMIHCHATCCAKTKSRSGHGIIVYLIGDMQFICWARSTIVWNSGKALCDCVAWKSWHLFCKRILVWPTSWTASCTTLKLCVCVCVCVYPGTCRHIARRMMNGWLWNFACMSGTILPTMCQIGDPVTQLSFKSYNA